MCDTIHYMPYQLVTCKSLACGKCHVTGDMHLGLQIQNRQAVRSLVLMAVSG